MQQTTFTEPLTKSSDIWEIFGYNRSTTANILESMGDVNYESACVALMHMPDEEGFYYTVEYHTDEDIASGEMYDCGTSFSNLREAMEFYYNKCLEVFGKVEFPVRAAFPTTEEELEAL